MNISILLLLIAMNVFLCLNYKLIAKKLKIFDIPDKFLKIHKKKTPLLGGLFFLINLIVLFLINQFFYKTFAFTNNREIFSFIFFLISFFLIGIYDDKYKVSFSIRIVLGFFIVLTIILINQNLKIDNLLFSFYNNKIFMKSFTILFTIFCILAFIHATNMFDGINSQLIIYYIILNTFLFYISNLNNIYLFFYPVLFSLFFLNFNGKIFLGDGGSYSFGAMYSFFLIYEYTTFQNIIYADEILILTLIPGLELIRLSLYRIYKGRNIFSGDLEHLHHLLAKKFNQSITNLIVSLMIVMPILFMMTLKINLHFILSITTILYFLVIYQLKITK